MVVCIISLSYHHLLSTTTEYGFSSFFYCSSAPLRWDAFETFLNSEPLNHVARSKGIFFADHNPLLLHQAGRRCEIEELEPFEDEDEALRETELVFIGQNLLCEALLQTLSACQVVV